MKKVTVSIILILSICVLVAGEQAKIFCVNLYSEETDIRLGAQDDYVFLMEGIPEFAASYLLATEATGVYNLYFKLASEDEWYFWADDHGSPYECPVNEDYIYCILIDTQGKVEYYQLTEDFAKNQVKVCFLNGTDDTLAGMAVSKSWADVPVAYVEDVASMSISNFISFKPSTYSLFWQFPSQVKLKQYFFLPDEENAKKPMELPFSRNAYYLYLTYTKGRTDYATLIDITPQ